MFFVSIIILLAVSIRYSLLYSSGHVLRVCMISHAYMYNTSKYILFTILYSNSSSSGGAASSREHDASPALCLNSSGHMHTAGYNRVVSKQDRLKNSQNNTTMTAVMETCTDMCAKNILRSIIEETLTLNLVETNTPRRWWCTTTMMMMFKFRPLPLSLLHMYDI